jgi:hypothetical protein
MPRKVSELEGTIGTPYCFENVEVDSIVFNMVFFLRERNARSFENQETEFRVEEDVLISLYIYGE